MAKKYNHLLISNISFTFGNIFASSGICSSFFPINLIKHLYSFLYNLQFIPFFPICFIKIVWTK